MIVIASIFFVVLVIGSQTRVVAAENWENAEWIRDYIDSKDDNLRAVIYQQLAARDRNNTEAIDGVRSMVWGAIIACVMIFIFMYFVFQKVWPRSNPTPLTQTPDAKPKERGPEVTW